MRVIVLDVEKIAGEVATGAASTPGPSAAPAPAASTPSAAAAPIPGAAPAPRAPTGMSTTPAPMAPMTPPAQPMAAPAQPTTPPAVQQAQTQAAPNGQWRGVYDRGLQQIRGLNMQQGNPLQTIAQQQQQVQAAGGDPSLFRDDALRAILDSQKEKMSFVQKSMARMATIGDTAGQPMAPHLRGIMRTQIQQAAEARAAQIGEKVKQQAAQKTFSGGIWDTMKANPMLAALPVGLMGLMAGGRLGKLVGLLGLLGGAYGAHQAYQNATSPAVRAGLVARAGGGDWKQDAEVVNGATQAAQQTAGDTWATMDPTAQQAAIQNQMQRIEEGMGTADMAINSGMVDPVAQAKAEAQQQVQKLFEDQPPRAPELLR